MADCCAPENAGAKSGCLICGSPLVYDERPQARVCAVCGGSFVAHEACEAGHYVCDSCHGKPAAAILARLRSSSEKSPSALFEELWTLPEVHLFGPEHHWLTPCVLLTCYKNCGGELDLASALDTAWQRGSRVPGGSCGYMGVCGAAAGVGIYFSILFGSTPTHPSAWSLPQKAAARALDVIAGYSGPRCCKRTCRMGVETAAAMTREYCLIDMPIDWRPCAYSGSNRECMRQGCPYYRKSGHM